MVIALHYTSFASLMNLFNASVENWVKSAVCIGFSNSDIYVCGPNWIERRFKITFEDKVTKAINFQQKECDTLNTRMRRTAELDVMAEVMLTIAEAKREGKTITLGDIEKKK